MKVTPKQLICCILFLILSINSYNLKAQIGFVNNTLSEKLWVDSVYNSLNLEERIAQLIMVRSFSNRGQRYTDSVANVISRYNIGGVIFFRGTPASQVDMTNRYQSAARTPVLIAMDAEWGPAMRLDSTVAFPRQLALGAIEDDALIYEMGVEIGRQLRRLGVHMSFSPVVDVNNNAGNPVINSRSFGENNLFVASKSLAYMRGLQHMGIISVAKHFPGHGDTDQDSHYTLPLISKPMHEIDSIHLFPYKYLIENGLNGVMTAHLAIPAIDPDPKAISSLSFSAVNVLLKQQLGFNGLVVTDGLEMKAIADFVHPDSVEIKALLAGNDILLLPVNTPRAIRNIRNAVKRGIIPESLIEERCRKVLTYKYRVGLARFKPISKNGLHHDLDNANVQLMNRRLLEATLTVPWNRDSLLPLHRPDTFQMASLNIGSRSSNIFTDRLNNYAPVMGFTIDKSAPASKFSGMIRKLSKFNLVFVCVRGTSQNPPDYGITRQTIDLVRSLAKKTRIVLVFAGNPYGLSLFEPIADLDAILVAYHDTDLYVDLAAQALFGAFEVTGELPVSASASLKAGAGYRLSSLNRLKYSIPEECGISSEWLQKADSIALRGIAESAYPGCRIIAVLDGVVFYDKCFGHHTYERKTAVTHNDVYDIASLTKIIATTPAIMYLYQHGMLDIDQRVSDYLPELRTTDKRNIIIRYLMAHQARLQSWIPFYREWMKNGNYDPQVFRSQRKGDFTVEIAKDLYMNRKYIQKIYDSIATSPLLNKQNFVYSDLGFIWLQEIVERVAGTSFDDFLNTTFFEPLGMHNTMFNARKQIEMSRIVPTENDKDFRKQLIHGYVHDPAAAMLGGVAGHAGLFSTANDLAIMMQLLMNGGNYGERQYFNPQVLSEFTRTQFPLNDNRRGLGFDKPELKRERNGPTSLSASNYSFGHSGFTGTYAWADPEHRLVFIFLSNRVHPNAHPNRLNSLNIRTAIHQVFYDALKKRNSAVAY